MRKSTAYLVALFCLAPLLQTAQSAKPGEPGARPESRFSTQLSGPAPSPGRTVKADLDFGRMPLSFIANLGQLDKRVAYYAQGMDKTIYFTSAGLTIVLSRMGEMTRDQADAASAARQPKTLIDGAAGEPVGDGGSADGGLPKRWVIKLDFVGANPEVKPIGDGQTEGTISYFKGRPADWKTGLPTYSRIVYRGLWPGIDLVYSGTVNRMKYEFIVQPGADPAQIELAYRGVTGLSIAEGGRLEVSSPLGSFHDEMPVAYQESEGRRLPVQLAYRLDEAGEEKDGTGGRKDTAGDQPLNYGFDVGAYDPPFP